MKKKIVVFSLFISLFSCENKSETMPKDILSEDKMVSIMTDIHLIEGELTKHHYTRDSSALLYFLYKKNLFKKYQINDSIYARSSKYYNMHPGLMDKVYGRIIDTLSLKEEESKR